MMLVANIAFYYDVINAPRNLHLSVFALQKGKLLCIRDNSKAIVSLIL